MDRLLTTMAIFIEYPLLAAMIGALLLGLGWRSRRRIVGVVGAIWLLYAAYETGMQQRWLCSGECNIRIDLLLIYPLLLLSLLVVGVSLLRRRRDPGSPSSYP
jgi:formate hydrogenlyase subunit 3/multisubunit Na+/H+ antiporter MnhD subunit